MHLARDAAFDNYCAYLPPAIKRWGILFDSAYHGAIVDELAARLADPILVDMRSPGAGAIASFARDHIADPELGLLAFLVNQPAFDHGYSNEQQDALSPFNRWGTHRMKVCFEVTDESFSALFAEPSRALRERCVDMQARAAAERRLSYSAGGRADWLDIDCAGATWVTQTGFEDYDYILPSGEIAACPRSIEGTISPEGWIVGTVPLGAKYGRIAAGDLSLRLARGQVVEISGNDPRLCADMEMVLTRVPSLRQVSEIGVGMSRAIAGAAAANDVAHLWLERHLGFHLGFGARLPQTDHPDIKATGHHLDLVFAHGVLRGAGDDALISW